MHCVLDAAVTSLREHKHTTSPTQPTHTLDGEKKYPKTVKFTMALFVFDSSPRGFPTFSDTGSCYKRLATSVLLRTRSCSKGPHHAFAKFLKPANHAQFRPTSSISTASSFFPSKTVPFPPRLLQEHPKVDQPGVCRVLLTYPFTERRSSSRTHRYVLPKFLEMEMDSHGGLEVTIRQTESKKKLPNNFVKQTPECS